MKKRFISAILSLLVLFILVSCKGDTGYKTDSVTGEVILQGENLAPAGESAGKERVFYEIFVGSFSDSNGDGTGDLRGIINRMDYLNDGDPSSGKSLGIEGIWLTPIFRSPSYHKYDVTNYYAIDEKFGTLDDLKELISLCHERGVKIILDLVINHTSKDNLWFTKFCNAHRENDTENEFYDYYSYLLEGETSSKKYGYITGTKERYECNFGGDMPELNFDNENVRKAVLDVAKYYLDLGVDGFRFDAAKYVYMGDEQKNVEFWNWYLGELRKDYPDIYTVAEVWDSDSVANAYTEATSVFNFTVAQAEGKLSAAAKKGNVYLYTAYVESQVSLIRSKGGNAVFAPFITNHDMDRAAGFDTLASGYAQMAANLLILCPGSPFIYYGEEIGMKGVRGTSNTDANRRLAMLWGDGDTVKNPVGSDYPSSKQTNGDVVTQYADPDSLYNRYKMLIMVRRANPEIAVGTYFAVSFDGLKAGGFISEYQGKSVLVVHNTSASEATMDIAETLSEHGLKDPYIKNCIGGDSALDGTALKMPPQSSVVIRFGDD